MFKKDIKHWIFDLDNTLYPAECDLFSQIDVKMGKFISEFLNVDLSEAKFIQKKYFKDYGTTLNGLMQQHNLKPELFLEYVHEIELLVIDRNEELDQVLHKLEGDKYIFTNGTVKHAKNVINRLGISHHFEEIYDIVSTSYVPKPDIKAYRHVVESSGVKPGNSVMFEDLGRNLKVPHELGMTTVLVQAKGVHPDEHLGVIGTGLEDHVHFTTDDLTEFLKKIA